MPKPYTFPTLYNEALQLNITKLKNWKYLIPEQIQSGRITWSVDGNEISSISILVNTKAEQSFIELDYKCNDEKIKYKVKLTSKPSNLGRGKLWYFICPKTNKHCRKLHLIGDYFLHRTAFKGCMYESQTYSKFYRLLGKTIGVDFSLDNLYSELYKKHFKKTYAGKPTKKYLKLSAKINQLESISHIEIATALAGYKI